MYNVVNVWCSVVQGIVAVLVVKVNFVFCVTIIVGVSSSSASMYYTNCCVGYSLFLCWWSLPDVICSL